VLKSAANARREDLLVYFGLNLFNGRTRYSKLPPELQRDIKVFFENATSAFEAARKLLFSVGSPEVVEQACRQAAKVGLGHLNEGLCHLTADHPGYEPQKQFDDGLVKLGLFDFAEYGPEADAFRSTLAHAGYTINGFELQNSSSLEKRSSR
jgi:hypothetical protein